MNSDVIIIGAGPGGYETAVYAAKKGLSVTLFEQRKAGGTCLHEGCIPTKCLCRSAEIADTITDCDTWGFHVSAPIIDFRRIMERKNEVVAQLTSGIEFLLKHKLITYIPERAELFDAHTVISESGEKYTAEHILIATGSTAKRPPIEGCDLPGVLTSTEMLDIDHIPQKLCIIGAGVIGLEFASIFRSFGSTVTMLEYAKEILPNFDSDISKRLKQVLSKRGIEFYNQAAVESIERRGAQLLVHYTHKGKYAKEILPNFDSDISKRLKQVLSKRGIEFYNQAAVESIERRGAQLLVHYTHKGKECSTEADIVLIAVGRSPRVESIGLDNAGVRYSPKGIETDDTLRTNIPGIYAIGDVNGHCMLAHAASFQGRKVIDHILGIDNRIKLDIIPAAVFTRPEAGMVGLTEEECKQRGIPFTAKKTLFRSNGKAISMGEPDGLCKLITDENGKIIGAHIFGAHAADLVQEVSALMNRETTVEQLKEMIHAHPTLSEILQECAREF